MVDSHCIQDYSRYRHSSFYTLPVMSVILTPRHRKKMGYADIQSHNTRCTSNLNFHLPRIRSNYFKHTFKFAITKILEEIPTSMKTLSYNKFKKKYKPILLKGAVSRNSANLGNYKMPIKLRET